MMHAEFYSLLILFIYMPCHFLEEALGDFPDWMYKHWTPMHISYGQWMGNNIFIFYPMLVFSFLLYHFQPVTLGCFGGGLLIWGIINFGEHLFYSFKDKKVSPGLWTACFYLGDALIGVRALFMREAHPVYLLMGMLVIGGTLFGGACYFSMKMGKRFEARFGKRVA